MKRLLLLFAICGLVTIVAFAQTKENRIVSDFTGINASSIFDITVAKGNTESLTIEADDNVMQYVRSEVRNGVLHLYLDNRQEVKNVKTLKAFLVMKNLNMVKLSGTCKLTANDLFISDKFKIECSGASNLTLNVNANELSIETSGATKIMIKANVNGSTYFNVSGSSKIRGELKTTNVNFDLSGTSLIELSGSAADISVNASGTSNFNAENFIVKTATIESSGVCNVSVNVTDVLKVNSSGLSSVNYKGSPSVEMNNSRSTKINKK